MQGPEKQEPGSSMLIRAELCGPALIFCHTATGEPAVGIFPDAGVFLMTKSNLPVILNRTAQTSSHWLCPCLRHLYRQHAEYLFCQKQDWVPRRHRE